MGKAKRRVRRLIFLFVVIGFALGLFILLYAPIFSISYIEVSGSTRYSDETIKEMSGLNIGQNGYRGLKLSAGSIFELRLTDSEKSINRLPYVKDSRVSLIFPNGVSIKITEREPAAYIRYLDNFLTVDGEGYVLESGNEPPEEDLREIRGIGFSKYTIGGPLEASNIELIRQAVSIINAVKSSDSNSELKLYNVLDWIDVSNSNNALMSLDNRIIVQFSPDDKLQYKIDFTKEIFFKKLNSKEEGRLEFSENQNPSFIPR